MASQFCWKLNFVFAMRLLLVYQLPRLLLVLQSPVSLMDVVSASPQIWSAKLFQFVSPDLWPSPPTKVLYLHNSETLMPC